jgi:hypothetical protein
VNTSELEQLKPTLLKTVYPISTRNWNEIPPNTITWQNNLNGGDTNAPELNAYHIITVKTVVDTYLAQIAISYAGTSIYVRTREGNTWYPWHRLSFA